jgi:hypothetical protein
MVTVKTARTVVLDPPEADALWMDVDRWATFIEGFAHAIEKDGSWPAEGSKLVWESAPGGRGRVNERVISRGDGYLTTRVVEESLHGLQTVTFQPAEGRGTRVELCLKYDLNPTTIWRQGPVGKLTDLLFIRRALTDSLARTLRRFATEAEEEQAL